MAVGPCKKAPQAPHSMPPALLHFSPHKLPKLPTSHAIMPNTRSPFPCTAHAGLVGQH